jgi:hypothetical protein
LPVPSAQQKACQAVLRPIGQERMSLRVQNQLVHGVDGRADAFASRCAPTSLWRCTAWPPRPTPRSPFRTRIRRSAPDAWNQQGRRPPEQGSQPERRGHETRQHGPGRYAVTASSGADRGPLYDRGPDGGGRIGHALSPRRSAVTSASHFSSGCWNNAEDAGPRARRALLPRGRAGGESLHLGWSHCR